MIFHSHNNQDNFFGLDISDLSIKLVQLKKNKGKRKIQALGKYNLKPGIIDKGVINKTDELIKAIQEIIRKPIFGNINSKNVVASLPENKVFIKSIELDNSPNQLKDLVLPTLEANFPYELDEIYYDWQLLHHNHQTQQVLVAAASKKIVDSYIDVLQAANLSVLALETESMAVCRCALMEESPNYKKKETKTYAIIDIGSKRSTMTIYANNTIILAMSLDVSGQSITNTIAETLQINISQAEKAKIICGLDKDKAEGIISDILSSMIKKMTEKIKQILLFYGDTHPDLNPIDIIYLSGGGSNIKDLDKVLGANLKLEIKNADAFINLDEKINKFNLSLTETHNINLDLLKKKKSKKKNNKKSSLSTKQNSALDYTTAIGLALRYNFD